MPSIDFTTEFGRRALNRLENEQVIWITTTSKSGAPQPSPVWFVWDGRPRHHLQPAEHPQGARHRAESHKFP